MTPLQRAGYAAHAISSAHNRAVASACAAIRAHPGHAVALSWGKDSLVLLHLALQCRERVTAVHARYSPNEELPDIPSVRDAFLSRYGDRLDYIEVPVWGDWELYERAGRFFLTPETAKERALLAEWHAQLVSAVDDAMIAASADGKMLGMAAHESRGRAANIAKRGAHYMTQAERLPKLLPLAHWSPRDVWAYMLAHDLPRLRIYEMADDPERARSEVAFAVIGSGADAIRRHGAWEEWARVYPEFWARWRMRWLGSNCEFTGRR